MVSGEQSALHTVATLIEAADAALAGEIAEAAAVLRAAHASGCVVSVCGNRTSGALVTAAGFGYGVYLPPGQTGDAILAVLPETPPDDLLGVIAAARLRGITVIALLCATPSPIDNGADIYLRVPTTDFGNACVVMVAVLHAIRKLAELEPPREAA